MISVDEMNAVEHLICELLTAQHQLGHRTWHFSDRLTSTLTRLTENGWVEAWTSLTPSGKSTRITARATQKTLTTFGATTPILCPHCSHATLNHGEYGCTITERRSRNSWPCGCGTLGPARSTRSTPRLDHAKTIIRDLTAPDPDPCTYDHHGHCLTHCWQQDSECPHARARKFLNP